MVLNGDVDLSRCCVVRQTRTTFHDWPAQFVGAAGTARVDPDRPTAEELRGVDPGERFFDGLLARGFVSGAEVAGGVEHDQPHLHAFASRSSFEFAQIFRVGRFVREKLIDELDAIDAEVASGRPREIEIGHFAGPKRLVERPFCQRDFEWFARRSFSFIHRKRENGQSEDGAGAHFEKSSSPHRLVGTARSRFVPEQTRGQMQNRFDKGQECLRHRKRQPERQRDQPDDWEKQERQNRHRPAQKQQDAPAQESEESCHGDIPLRPHPGDVNNSGV